MVQQAGIRASHRFLQSKGGGQQDTCLGGQFRYGRKHAFKSFSSDYSFDRKPWDGSLSRHVGPERSAEGKHEGGS